MVKGMQSGVFIQRFAFDKERADAVKRSFSLLLAQFVKCFKNGLVQVTRPQIPAFVLSRLETGDFTEVQIRRVRSLDEVQMLGINEV
jgi:hypothetical protein